MMVDEPVLFKPGFSQLHPQHVYALDEQSALGYVFVLLVLRLVGKLAWVFKAWRLACGHSSPYCIIVFGRGMEYHDLKRLDQMPV